MSTRFKAAGVDEAGVGGLREGEAEAGKGEVDDTDNRWPIGKTRVIRW